MEAEHGLSVAAQRSRDARLPGLLLAVRRRGRRRRRRRAFVAAVLLVLLAVVVGRAFGPGVASSPDAWPSPPAFAHGEPRRPNVAAAQVVVVPGSATATATFVRDDPGVLARHAVATQERGAWFVDDAGLQALLREDGRAEGLVRLAERVLVRADVVDPYGGVP
ncbi:MAG: hypothetical protein JNL12_12810 [Planctomycetes bacterium]|nr:hypothetical protein [Planctomycetota bacterium]